MKKKDKKITALFMTFCIILGLLSQFAPDWSVKAAESTGSYKVMATSGSSVSSGETVTTTPSTIFTPEPTATVISTEEPANPDKTTMPSTSPSVTYTPATTNPVPTNPAPTLTPRTTPGADVTVTNAPTTKPTVVTTKKSITVVDKKIVAPGKVKITKAKNVSKKKIKLTWKKQSKALVYQVKYSIYKSFRKPKTKATMKCFYTLSGLKKKKTYYIKVRGYTLKKGKRLYGKWSTVKKVKVKK
ncbi:hypothetical protein [Butyribacter intestini]|uniref:hypothetical protein n=1 Tax=Butyribacter intestini TaxID=1703332 RepID=UPI0024CD3CF2|nr:MAG: hypothetical protein OGM15_05900 [Lachnospiraceae bacterium]